MSNRSPMRLIPAAKALLLVAVWLASSAAQNAALSQTLPAPGGKQPAIEQPAPAVKSPAPAPGPAVQPPATATATNGAGAVEPTQDSSGQSAQPESQAPPPTEAPPPPLVLPPMEDVLNPVAQTVATMESLEREFDAIKASDTELGLQRAELERLTSAANSAGDALKPRIEAAKVQLEKLGPAPKDKHVAEAQQIAAERTRLTTIITTLEGAFKSTELVKVRASQLTARVQDVRHGLFTQNLFKRTGSPLLPGIWRQLADELPNAQRQANAVFGTWRAIIVSRPTSAALIFGGALLTYLALKWMLSFPLRRIMPPGRTQPPTYARRAAAAALAAPLYAVPGVVALSAFYSGAQSADLIYSRVEALAEQFLQAAIIVVVVSALARAILEPRRPEWRLMDLSDAASRSLLRSTLLIAYVYGIDQVLKEAIRILILPLPFSVVLSFVTSLAFAGLLFKVVATPFVPAKRSTQPEIPETDLPPLPGEPAVAPRQSLSRYTPRWLKFPLLIVAIGIVGSALAGYVALSRFAAGQVVITGSAVVLVALFHIAIRTTERAFASPQTLMGGWLAKGLGVEEGHRRLIARTLSILLHIVLASIAIPAVFLAWGFSSDDVLAGTKQALLGFQIGQLRISLVRILLAVALFLSLLFATRLIQRWLQAEVLRPDRMDPGIANSIHQGIGYAGFALAAMVAVSFGGLDITNLAILAGALSVGIGFGLQSIVNNFVSGLILLVERPIKVGDLVMLRGGGQGFVRSISVRSTEIETFEKSSLIVPNSELISNVVTNWTHRNALARVTVKVGASYKSDPARVLEILKEVARTTPLAMQQPPPYVSFDNLGPDALEFSIGVVVADVNKGGDCQTQLRIGVYQAFVKNGIEFPTVERDIYLRDLDGVKTLLARVVEERQQKAAADALATVMGTASKT